MQSVLKQVQEHLQLAERTMLYALNFDVNVHLPLPSTSVVREAWKLGYKEDHPIVQQALNVVKARCVPASGVYSCRSVCVVCVFVQVRVDLEPRLWLITASLGPWTRQWLDKVHPEAD